LQNTGSKGDGINMLYQSMSRTWTSDQEGLVTSTKLPTQFSPILVTSWNNSLTDSRLYAQQS